MKQVNLPFNWFDILLLLVLAMGIFRGRKRGMSQELLTFLQWVVTVLAAGFAYRPLGELLSSHFEFLGKLGFNVTAYLLVVAVIALIFLGFKRAFHGKLIGSDAFGKAEYYLGMPAGMVRFLCVLFCGLALVNARLYTQAELDASRKFALENYGKEYFPGLRELQVAVFEHSFVGPHIKKHLAVLLISPTPTRGVQKYKQKEWSPGV